MGYYNNATICKDGHVISRSKKSTDKYCNFCGAENISECPHCGTSIKGTYETPEIIVIGGKYTVPQYCHECGKPYPWTEASIATLSNILLEIDDLNPEEVERVIELIPSIIVESPKTDLAIIRLQKLIGSAKDFAKQIIINSLMSYACDKVLSFFK